MSATKAVTFAELVVFASPVGKDEFKPAHKTNVPEKIREPRVMAMLADGMECEFDNMVYRAVDRNTMGLMLAH